MSKRYSLVIGIVVLFVLVYGLAWGLIIRSAYINSKSENVSPSEEEITSFNTTSEVSTYNKYTLKSLSEDEIALMYFNDYKDLIVNYLDEAYDLVENKDDISKTALSELRDDINSNYYGYSLQSYTYAKYTNYTLYKIVTSSNNILDIKVYSAMNYMVYITL